MHAFLKTKAGRLAFFTFVMISSGFSVYSFVDLVREKHVRFIDQDLGAALAESQKLPPGFARAEDYLRRLKAIKTAYAPPEMQQALFDYIAAYEKSLIATEAGRGVPPGDSKAMIEAKERLVAAEQKYN